MALFGNQAELKRHHFLIAGKQTTVALEEAFWRAIQAHQGADWRQWVAQVLEGAPEACGRARWLRVAVLSSMV